MKNNGADLPTMHNFWLHLNFYLETWAKFCSKPYNTTYIFFNFFGLPYAQAGYDRYDNHTTSSSTVVFFGRSFRSIVSFCCIAQVRSVFQKQKIIFIVIVPNDSQRNGSLLDF